MSEILNYKCPSCTAPLRYDGEEGMLKCGHCNSTYSVSEIEALMGNKAEEAIDDENKWDSSRLQSEWGEEINQLKLFNCPSCGAELITEETTISTGCPYCDNPTVVAERVSGILRPDYIIPFKLSREDAKDALREFYSDKLLLSNEFRDENKIDELKGIYVPFWLFKGKSEGDVICEGSNTYVYMVGDYQVTETNYYFSMRKGFVRFDKIPVDASKRMPDDYMDSLEPYYYEDLKEFSTAFLPGYLADRYDLSVEDCAKRADLRARNTLVDLLVDDIKRYEKLEILDTHVDIERREVYYALLPVYILKTKWKEEEYLFAMNGQTGKFSGRLPIDESKFIRYVILYFLMVAVPVSAIIYAVIPFFLPYIVPLFK